ncbi:MAG: hypothetical protein P0Y55_14990 [Candidatus Cohnella colombiensis]|uniref:Periplasmic heavy metal sensor n=1 Tax=Candidatus Cohnella colombiensis TaxID=3121368 RepID=A0AA95EYT3_9BACL|nr:MAG: hypothetical protein P0Y55_14990 [Cohnella sp.]
MHNRLITIIMIAVTLVLSPTLVDAAPNHKPHPQQPNHSIDWNAYPADIQAFKLQLDHIRDQQKALFKQMKEQHNQLRTATQTLSPEERKQFEASAGKTIEQLKNTRDVIHALRSQKHSAWDQFHKHAAMKKWTEAKADLESILKQKQQILVSQQNIVNLQKQLITLIKPATGTHLHSEG